MLYNIAREDEVSSVCVVVKIMVTDLGHLARGTLWGLSLKVDDFWWNSS
jgi:hypothetical protein